MRALVVGWLVLAVFTANCGKMGGLRSKQAVREAIQAHLKKQSNLVMTNMTMEVEDVKFDGDSAEAQVRFQSTQSPDLAVGVRYTLRRVDDHWEVRSSSPTSGTGTSPHGRIDQPGPGTAPATPTPKSSH
jgi:hypothetical protein